MGVPPEVSATLTGTVASIKKEKVQEVIDANQDNKFLGAILKGVQTASDVQNKLGDLGFKGVEADVKLLPPTVKVGFLDKRILGVRSRDEEIIARLSYFETEPRS
jgi:hypothetical protein